MSPKVETPEVSRSRRIETQKNWRAQFGIEPLRPGRPALPCSKSSDATHIKLDLTPRAVGDGRGYFKLDSLVLIVGQMINQNHPTRKLTPPNGVIAPSHLMFVTASR